MENVNNEQEVHFENLRQSYAWRWIALVLLVCGGFALASLYHEPPPLPVVVEPPGKTKWENMVVHLNELVAHYNGEVGVFLKDLKSNRVYEYNGDRSFVSASLIKIPIMTAVFQAVWEGRISLNTKIQLRKSYRRGGSGRLKWAKTGSYYTVSQLVYTMITKSDNTATAMLIDKLGYDYLNNSFKDFGLVKTQIRPTGMSLANTLDPSKDNLTTPKEMASLLEKLYRHQIVNDGLSDMMMEIMKGANYRSRLSQYMPREWELARKTGLLRNSCHDVGIFFAPSGDFILCVFTDHNSSYRKAKGFIASVGRTAFGYLGST